MSFWLIIEQQFLAEKSLLSDGIINELFIINLATVPGRRNSISQPEQSPVRWQSRYPTSSNFKGYLTDTSFFSKFVE